MLKQTFDIGQAKTQWWAGWTIQTQILLVTQLSWAANIANEEMNILCWKVRLLIEAMHRVITIYRQTK